MTYVETRESPHGSGWIVQVQPTQGGGSELIPPTAVGGSFRGVAACRLDLKDPPTAVGGISFSESVLFVGCISNDPPTAVGGIQVTYDNVPPVCAFGRWPSSLEFDGKDNEGTHFNFGCGYDFQRWAKLTLCMRRVKQKIGG